MRKEIKETIEREIVTISEFAAEKGVQHDTVKKAVQKGRIEAVKKGRDWLLDREDIRQARRKKS